MKKFLSLVMALAMTLTLVTVGASATDYADLKDKGSITYTEAVEVMNKLGIISGYTDGSFKPTGSITRGAAAKIICTIVLGPTTASALGASTSPFSDVPVTNVFAGYIAYCKNAGLIDGYADGTFKPANSLTGYQFAKMLLNALGITGEYTGTNWSVNVAKAAVDADLFDGLSGVAFSAISTREQACQMALNAMKYTASSDVYEVQDTDNGNAVVGTFDDKNDAYLVVALHAGYIVVKTKDYSDSLLSSVFDVTVADAADAYGCPATIYSNDDWSDSLTYTDAATYTYTSKVTNQSLYNTVGKTVVTDYTWNVTVPDKTSDTFGSTANGVQTLIFVDSDAKTVTVKYIQTYVGYIDAFEAYDEDTDTDAYVSINTMGDVSVGDFTTNDFNDDDVDNNTVVLYTLNTDGDIETAIPATSVNGYISSVSSSSFIAGGTTYKYSANKAATVASGDLKDTMTVYLDSYGYAIYVETYEADTSDNIAYVANTGSSDDAFGNTTYYAKLVYPDGSVATKETDISYSGLKNTIVTYSVNDDSQFELTAATGADEGTAISLTKGVAGIATTYVDPSFGGTVYANSNTIFVVETTDDDGNAVYTTYTGIANVPSLTATSGATVAYGVDDGFVTYMFISDATETDTSSSNTIYVVYDADVTSTTDVDNGTYYVYNAVVDGSVTTVKTKNALAADTFVKSMTTNSDGVVTGFGTAVTATSTTGTVKAANGVIGLGGAYYTYASDVAVYMIDDCVITASSISSIKTDANDGVTFTVNDDGAVSAIYITVAD